jgi:hypothetical protein
MFNSSKLGQRTLRIAHHTKLHQRLLTDRIHHDNYSLIGPNSTREGISSVLSAVVLDFRSRASKARRGRCNLEYLETFYHPNRTRIEFSYKQNHSPDCNSSMSHEFLWSSRCLCSKQSPCFGKLSLGQCSSSIYFSPYFLHFHSSCLKN